MFFVISHIYREGNQCVDGIAKSANSRISMVGHDS
jgi:hypothetical protein